MTKRAAKTITIRFKHGEVPRLVNVLRVMERKGSWISTEDALRALNGDSK